jgi:hypothetical protein
MFPRVEARNSFKMIRSRRMINFMSTDLDNPLFQYTYRPHFGTEYCTHTRVPYPRVGLGGVAQDWDSF